ncbi:MAG: DUF4834 family protein [Bacteroidales bacterium]|nr:DUF4834 family protein [Bacteroidales bacterium]
MTEFFSFLFITFLFVLALIATGLYLLSKMVGGFSNLKSIYRAFKGKNNSNANPRGQQNQSTSSNSSSAQSSHSNEDSTTDRKVFGRNEGTYVDFEDVK